MAIVVTGTSGNLGRLVVEKLLARGVAPAGVVATARDTSKVEDLAARGVRTAALDYDAVDASVLSEGDVLVLVSSSAVGQRERQHRNVVEAARQAGVARVVYTSVANIDSDLVVAPEHRATEALIRESGLPATFLRNGWYTENYTAAFGQAQATGRIASATGEGRVASVERADQAEAAAVVATTEGHEGAAYELVGQHAWTHAELAATFGEVLGREVGWTSLDGAAYRQALLEAGLDEGTVGFLVAADANIEAGLLAGTGDDLANLLGRAPRTLAETVADWR